MLKSDHPTVTAANVALKEHGMIYPIDTYYAQTSLSAKFKGRFGILLGIVQLLINPLATNLCYYQPERTASTLDASTGALVSYQPSVRWTLPGTDSVVHEKQVSPVDVVPKGKSVLEESVKHKPASTPDANTGALVVYQPTVRWNFPSAGQVSLVKTIPKSHRTAVAFHLIQKIVGENTVKTLKIMYTPNLDSNMRALVVYQPVVRWNLCGSVVLQKKRVSGVDAFPEDPLEKIILEERRGAAVAFMLIQKIKGEKIPLIPETPKREPVRRAPRGNLLLSLVLNNKKANDRVSSPVDVKTTPSTPAKLAVATSTPLTLAYGPILPSTPKRGRISGGVALGTPRKKGKENKAEVKVAEVNADENNGKPIPSPAAAAAYARRRHRRRQN
ncbi:unnamed protein product [Somion occarium]|uniref:Uncharacterized protein n=1 Tax=Somion occarium TaxID=3059160 RepID=A0ABP1DIL6_9APHY